MPCSQFYPAGSGGGKSRKLFSIFEQTDRMRGTERFHQPNYKLLTPTGDFQKNILSDRSVSHAFDPMVIRLLANTWAQGISRDIEPTRLAEVVGNLNMRRADPLNDLENRLGVIKGDRKKFLKLRDPAWEEATKTLITEARELSTPRS